MVIYLSDSEKLVYDAMKELGYGRLFDVSIPANDERKHIVQPSDAFMSMVNAVRDGVCEFTELVVHQGEPMQGLTKTTVKGFKAEKRYKFN